MRQPCSKGEGRRRDRSLNTPLKILNVKIRKVDKGIKLDAQDVKSVKKVLRISLEKASKAEGNTCMLSDSRVPKA